MLLVSICAVCQAQAEVAVKAAEEVFKYDVFLGIALVGFGVATWLLWRQNRQVHADLRADMAKKEMEISALRGENTANTRIIIELGNEMTNALEGIEDALRSINISVPDAIKTAKTDIAEVIHRASDEIKRHISEKQ